MPFSKKKEPRSRPNQKSKKDKKKDLKGFPFYKLSTDPERLYDIVCPRVVDHFYDCFGPFEVPKSDYLIILTNISNVFKTRGALDGVR